MCLPACLPCLHVHVCDLSPCHHHTKRPIQLEAPAHPTLQGNLIPQFHLFYWMGLRLNASWPSFGWTDPFIIGPAGFYTNWGITRPDGEPEPSRPDFGLVAGANYTEVQRNPPVWGWSDEDPNIKHIFICRAAGDRP
jgi:hypothetical protein